MPTEEDKPTTESGETPESGGEVENTEGGKKKLIMFGLIGVGAVVLGVVLALFVLKPMMAPSDSDETAQVEEEHKPEQKKDDHGSKDAHGETGGEALMYSINDIVINPAGTGGSRFLSVSFGFELESPRMLGEFKAREPVIRDALITILSSKTVAQLTDVRQKEIIRYQIKKRVAELMDTEALAGVYYTDFVLQ
jgi:flagellar FliL protein